MSLKFDNLNQLVDYLSVLERRVEALETENARLRTIQPVNAAPLDKKLIAKHVGALLPRTDIIHPSFIKRSFAIWGHMFVAQLIIGTIVAVAYFCFVSVIFGSFFGSLIRQSQ